MHFPLSPRLLAASACLTSLIACNTADGGSGAPGKGAAHLETLLHNPKWYRVYDSADVLTPDDGSLIFSWTYRDAMRHPDSFHLAIDTLWGLPQNVNGDTANDWDLDMCPSGFCIGGLREGISGVNIATPFAASGVDVDTFFTEHHFQFTPALGAGALPVAPAGSVFGGMMILSSRSGSSPADTVFGFGTWKMEWDTAFPPPVRPVGGHLPKRADFKIVDGKVRYQP